MSPKAYYPDMIFSPYVVNRVFDGINTECILVDILNYEYRKCEEISLGDNFWSNSKAGAYGAGLGRTENDCYKPVRTGLLGQMAFSKIFWEPVDFIYREGGDEQDNLINGWKIDVKCAQRNRGEVLVYCYNEWGKKIPLTKDVYVSCYMESEDRILQRARIILVGYSWRDDVLNSEIKVGYKGNGHMNYVLRFSQQRPILDFLKIKKEINLRRLKNENLLY